MAARVLWEGQLRLALVSIPVEVYAATPSAPAISFHQIHKPSGQRIHYRKVIDGVGEVDPDDIVKGYQNGGFPFGLLDPPPQPTQRPERLAASRISSTQRLHAVATVKTQTSNQRRTVVSHDHSATSENTAHTHCSKPCEKPCQWSWPMKRGLKGCYISEKW
jgi:hypothetical protein